MTAVHIGIDPGTDKSGIVSLFPDSEKVEFPGVVENGEMISACEEIVHAAAVRFPAGVPVHVGVEMIASYGMPVGQSVFETLLWIGHFITKFPALAAPVRIKKVFRIQVKSHLCHSAKAKDANVRQALIDLFPATGGGKIPQIGTKSERGPLYGVSSHAWAALGVAVTARDTWDSLNGFGMISDPLQAHFTDRPQ